MASTVLDTETVVKELEAKMKELADHVLGKSSSTISQSPFAPASSIRRKIESLQSSILEAQNAQQNAQSKLPPVPVPNFDGSDLESFLKEFGRWMRLTGVESCAEKVQLDWLVQACTPKVRKLVEKVVDEKASMFDVLCHLESLFPKLENDISLRLLLDKIPALGAQPDPPIVAQLFLEIEEIFSRMSAGSMSEQEKFLALIKKLHPKTFAELRGDRYYKHRCEDYISLKDAILEKSKEDWLERHLFAQKKQVLQTLDAQPSNPSMDLDEKASSSQTPSNGKGKGKGSGKGNGKGKGKGKGKGDSMPSRNNLPRYQKDPNLQTQGGENSVPRFSATIWCKWCNKKGHYEDSCWSKEKYEKKKEPKMPKEKSQHPHPKVPPKFRRTPRNAKLMHSMF